MVIRSFRAHGDDFVWVNNVLQERVASEYSLVWGEYLLATLSQRTLLAHTKSSP
jgi:hypothetical protein